MLVVFLWGWYNTNSVGYFVDFGSLVFWIGVVDCGVHNLTFGLVLWWLACWLPGFGLVLYGVVARSVAGLLCSWLLCLCVCVVCGGFGGFGLDLVFSLVFVVVVSWCNRHCGG